MAKYKLTVKYNDVCDLSLESDISDIIGSEFDQYVKSMLYKKEDWENFETNFKEAARLEYGKLSKKAKESAEADNSIEAIDTANAEEKTSIASETADNSAPKTADNSDDKQEAGGNATVLNKIECDIKSTDDVLDFSENNAAVEKEGEKNITAAADNSPKDVKEAESAVSKEEVQKPAKKEKKLETLSFREYIENKNINTPLDEFVVGACYLDEISNIKEFSLKQLNAKLFPAFGRLANSEVIESAIERVLIEAVKSGSKTMYKINENAWNYHNYDLVKH